MVTITSAELQRDFGKYRELAQREPITVKHYGSERIVLISVDEYKRLKSLDTRETSLVINLSDEEIAELEKRLAKSASQF